MDNLLVSINCITYNHERYIEDALKSFLMQETNFTFEILIHDDASTDGTVDIIKKYQKMYPEIIKPIFQKENQYSRGIKRIMHTFNDKRAMGKYIALCEGDDYWTDTYKLQKQVEYMESNPSCSMCFHAAEIVDVNKNPIGNTIKPYVQNCISSIDDNIVIGGGLCPTASILYPKELVENMPEFFMDAHVGDYPLQMILASKGYVYYIDEIMSAYRTGDNGSWTNRMYFSENRKVNAINNNNNNINLLNEFNKFTNYKYSNSVEKKILFHRANIAFINGELEKLKNKEYEEYYKNIEIKEKIKLYFRYYFPSLWEKLAKMKRKLVSVHLNNTNG
ncbi:glycosyltransferase [Clostridium beijerinckii]|uniref:glycosyltransferase n=1 Tax=Clostridium beijerinckii TaxID=1520 RepID=UPI00156EEC56|nr:glycosyltransferase [Clostridium beijerinckii]NRT70247.1 glycosyltransferase involved in cell wall biosynthesis [Clostridium beijerinckii]